MNRPENYEKSFAVGIEFAEDLRSALGDLNCLPTRPKACSPKVCVGDQINKKESAMRATIDTMDTNDSSKQYLLSRVQDVYDDKRSKISEQFLAPHPKDIKEAREWFKSGNFRLDLPEHLKDTSPVWGHLFVWGKEATDHKKEDALKDQLKAARQKAKDIINVMEKDEIRLQALKDFEDYKVN